MTWQEHTVKCTVQMSTQTRAQSIGSLAKWLMFIYKLSYSGFKSSYCHLIFRFCAYFKGGVPWHSCNYRVCIHSETRTWDRSIICIRVRTQINHLASLTKWFSVRIRAKWFWIRFQLQSFKLQISLLLPATSSLTFRKLKSVDSLWSTYVTWQEHTVKCTVEISTQNTAQSFGQFW